VASLIRADPELLDVYLGGAEVSKLLTEVTCGTVELEGVQVKVPSTHYSTFLERLKGFADTLALLSFFAHRCDSAFLRLAMPAFPNLVSPASDTHYRFDWRPRMALAVRLHQFDLLSEPDRLRLASIAREDAVEDSDGGVFDMRDARVLLTAEEWSGLRDQFKADVIPNLEDLIDTWESDRGRDEEVTSYFSTVSDSLGSLKREFHDDEQVMSRLLAAEQRLDDIIADAEEPYGDFDPDDYYKDESPAVERPTDRSIFDDLDE
jgi:hypothetical protein